MNKNRSKCKRSARNILSKTLFLSAVVGVPGVVAAVAAAPASSSKAGLQFTKDGDFHISVFNDLHFGESKLFCVSLKEVKPLLDSQDADLLLPLILDAAGQGPLWDLKTSQIMADVLDAEKPQLVVINGDLISGDEYKGKDIIDHIDRIVKPVVERRLPWASTYGNHDSDRNLSRDQMFAREKTYNGSYTERMVTGADAGVTNYYLPVYGEDCADASEPDTTTCVPALLLWFFDSRGGKYYQTRNRQPDWVDTTVVDWFTTTSRQLSERYGRVVPSLAFVHIPIHATVILQKQGKNGKLDLRRHPGINDDKIHGQSTNWNSVGKPMSRRGYGGRDKPFMQALVATKGLIGLFQGHDHGNSWCFRWTGKVGSLEVDGPDAGLHMCYGQRSGYGGYGNWIRGSRQIVLSRERVRSMTADTHIRLETGDVVGAVTLNSTFNNDVYAKVPDKKSILSLAGKNSDLTATIY